MLAWIVANDALPAGSRCSCNRAGPVCRWSCESSLCRSFRTSAHSGASLLAAVYSSCVCNLVQCSYFGLESPGSASGCDDENDWMVQNGAAQACAWGWAYSQPIDILHVLSSHLSSKAYLHRPSGTEQQTGCFGCQSRLQAHSES